MSKPTTKVARAIREQSRRSARRASLRVNKAVVQKVKPLKLKVLGKNDIFLDEDQVVLSQNVRKYDADHGIEVGDSIIITRLPVTGEFIGVTIESPNKGLAGVRHKAPKDPLWNASQLALTVTSFTGGVSPPTSGAGHVVLAGKLEVHNKDGTVVGYIPIVANSQIT